MISMNLVTLCYLIASVCFIQALKGLSHPTTSRLGNAFGIAGMALAILTTAALIYSLAREGTATVGLAWVVFGLVIGGTIGTVMAKRVEMTKMPELVAFMHSMIGLAAVAIAVPDGASTLRSWCATRPTAPRCMTCCAPRPA